MSDLPTLIVDGDAVTPLPRPGDRTTEHTVRIDGPLPTVEVWDVERSVTASLTRHPPVACRGPSHPGDAMAGVHLVTWRVRPQGCLNDPSRSPRPPSPTSNRLAA